MPLSLPSLFLTPPASFGENNNAGNIVQKISKGKPLQAIVERNRAPQDRLQQHQVPHTACRCAHLPMMRWFPSLHKVGITAYPDNPHAHTDIHGHKKEKEAVSTFDVDAVSYIYFFEIVCTRHFHSTISCPAVYNDLLFAFIVFSTKNTFIADLMLLVLCTTAVVPQTK